MPRPTDPPISDWASDGVHSDPGEAWDGQPSAVAPSSGQIAAGALPNQVLPAEFYNYIVSNFGSWLDYLSELTREEVILIPASAFNAWGAAFASGSGYGLETPVLRFAAGADRFADLDLAPYVPRDVTITRVRVTGSFDGAADDLNVYRIRHSRASVLPPTTQFKTPLGAPTSGIGGWSFENLDTWTPLAEGANVLRLETPAANADVTDVFDVEIRFTR